MILVSSAALLWGLPLTLQAQDRPVTPVSEGTQGIQVTAAEGRLVFSNSGRNAPLLPVAQPASKPLEPLDGDMPGDIQLLVDRISRTHGVDPKLVAAVMKVESNYNRWARSSKGALGLMQLIPATGHRFGVSNFFDAAENIEGGVRYLKFLSDKFGKDKLDLLLAAYNAGENTVERFGRVPPIRETTDYVRKVTRIYKPENRATVSATADAQTAAAPAPPPPKQTIIYSTVDEYGVTHFSNMGPPN